MRKLFSLILIFLLIISAGVIVDIKEIRIDDTAYILPGYRHTVKAAEYHNFNNYYLHKLGNFAYGAHRGAALLSKEPENSLTAFQDAKNMGYTIVETDLQLTKDNQWIIMHDYTLDRTTDGKGKISNYTLRDIKKLRLKNRNGHSLPIPTLDEFLNLCTKDNFIPILDIKPGIFQISPTSYDILIRELKKHYLLDKAIFCSYSKPVLSQLRSRDDETTIAAMIGVSEANLDFVKRLGNAFIYCNYRGLSEDKLRMIKENYVKFGVWTVNNIAVAQHFRKQGTILIVTDKLT